VPREDSYPSIIGLRLPQPAVVGLFGMAICFEPGQEATDAAARQGDARIRGAIVEIDGVAVCSNGTVRLSAKAESAHNPKVVSSNLTPATIS